MKLRVSRTASIAINLIVLILFVGFIEHFIGWAKLAKPWTEISATAVLIGIILTLASYSLRAYRIFDYFRAATQSRFLLCMKLTLQHNLLNNLLPMRSGELSFPILMQRYFSASPQQTVPALLWFRFLDLHTIALLAIPFGLPMLLDQAFTPPTVNLLTGCLLLLWLSLPGIFYTFYRSILRRLTGSQHRIALLIIKLTDGLPHGGSQFLRSWILTIANWGLKLAVFAWILGLFTHTGFSINWIGATLGDLTSVLPVHSFAGLGTYEAGVVAGLVPFGTPAQTALQAAVNLHLFILGCTLISGILSIFIPKKP